MYRKMSHEGRHEHIPENRSSADDAHQGESGMSLNSSRSPSGRHPVPGIGIRRSYDQQDYEPLPLNHYLPESYYPGSVASASANRQISHNPRPDFGVYEGDRRNLRSPNSDAYSHHQEPRTSSGHMSDRKRPPDENASEDSLDSSDSKNRQKKHGSKKRPLTAYRMFYRDERTKLLSSEGDNLSRKELDRLIDSKWNTLSDAEKQRYDNQAFEESKRFPGEEQGRERSTPVAYEGAMTEEAQRRKHYVDTHFQRSAAEAPILLRTVDGSTHDVSERYQSFVPPPVMSQAHRSRIHSFPSLGGPAMTPLGDQFRSQPELIQHQSAMQFDGARHAVLGAQSRDRLELPPSRTVMVHDLNGTPRRYELMYAAISLPFDSANEYLASLSSATSRLLDGSGTGSQNLSSTRQHRSPPFHAAYRPEFTRGEERYDPRQGDFRHRR